MTDAAPLPDLASAAAWFGAPGRGGFAAGTLIETVAGPVAVERLSAGDRLADGARLRHVARLDPSRDGAVLLPAGALGPGRPDRNLVLAARQGVRLAGGWALAAGGLCCGGAVRPLAEAPPLHGLLADAAGAVALAEGLACALGPAVRPEHDPAAGAALAAARRAQGAAAEPARLDGAVTLDGPGRLVGWARAGAAPVLLEVLGDDATIGFALADGPRPDLAMAGLGAVGFAFTLPPGRGVRLLGIVAVGSGAALPGTPLLVAGGHQW